MGKAERNPEHLNLGRLRKLLRERGPLLHRPNSSKKSSNSLPLASQMEKMRIKRLREFLKVTPFPAALAAPLHIIRAAKAASEPVFGASFLHFPTMHPTGLYTFPTASHASLPP